MITTPDEHLRARAMDLLAHAGYVVLLEKTHRAAQERQRIAEHRKQWAEEKAASSERWARNCLDEERRLRDRLTFVYGVARAHGATVLELLGPDAPEEIRAAVAAADDPLPLSPGEDDTEVWIPPANDCLHFRYDKPCPHCGAPDYHQRTRRCGACGRRP